MQDDLTRYLIVTPMANQEATTVAEKFVENVVCFTGAPNELVTDQGTNFMSQVMKDVCSLLKIKKINTSAYHPQGNIVERANRELKLYLRQFVGKNYEIWDRFLPYFAMEYNTTTNSSTGFTPYELIFGRKARLPSSIYKERGCKRTYTDFSQEMKTKLTEIHEIARKNLIESKEKRKQKYDRNAIEWQPMWGEMVLVRNIQTGVGQKLQGIWRGPYEVVDIPSEQTCVIKNGKKLEKIHNNRLKRFNE